MSDLRLLRQLALALVSDALTVKIAVDLWDPARGLAAADRLLDRLGQVEPLLLAVALPDRPSPLPPAPTGPGPRDGAAAPEHEHEGSPPVGLTDKDRTRLRALLEQPAVIPHLTSLERGRLRAVRQGIGLAPEEADLIDRALAIGRRAQTGGAA